MGPPSRQADNFFPLLGEGSKIDPPGRTRGRKLVSPAGQKAKAGRMGGIAAPCSSYQEQASNTNNNKRACDMSLGLALAPTRALNFGAEFPQW